MSSRPFIYTKEHYNIDRMALNDNAMNAQIFNINHTLAVLGYATAVLLPGQEDHAKELTNLYTKAGWDVAMDKTNPLGISLHIRDKQVLADLENLFKF